MNRSLRQAKKATCTFIQADCLVEEGFVVDLNASDSEEDLNFSDNEGVGAELGSSANATGNAGGRSARCSAGA